MTKFFTLLKFEFLSNTLRFKNEKLFSRIKNLLLTILGYGLIVAIFIYAINTILDVFVGADMQHEFVILFSTFMIIGFFVSTLISSVKILFFKVNLSILNLPLNGSSIFFSKVLFMFIKQLFFWLILNLPVFILFGIKTAQSAGFYIAMLPNLIFMLLFPFLLAILLTSPVMWIIKFLKNRFFVMFVLYTIALVAGFVLYIYGLKFVLHILESGNFSNVFDSSTVFKIKQFSSYLYLPILFKNMLMIYNFWKSLPIVLAMICVLIALIYVFAEKMYVKVIFSSKSIKNFSKKTKVVSENLNFALLMKEFKNIFRSPNYSFQYFTIVITTPLMVYFSSEIASSIGASFLGESVLSGIVVLILIMFLSMGTSFSATSITREGDNFYLTKIMPISYTKQIAIKFVIYVLVSFPAILISCLILSLVGFIEYLSAFLMFLGLCFVMVGNICCSILMDIKNPQFQFLENGEVSNANKNVSSAIGIGFFISILTGLGAIVLSFFIKFPTLYLVLFGFGIPYATWGMFKLFFRLEERYNRIEV